MERVWFYDNGGYSGGPLTIDELRAAISREPAQSKVKVWRAGLSVWQDANQVEELRTLNVAPPPRPFGEVEVLSTPSASITPPAPPVEAAVSSLPELAQRLILVAIGWFLLAQTPAFAIGFAIGVYRGFVEALSQGRTILAIPATLEHLLISTVGGFCAGAILLYATLVRGRIVGFGDARIGLGLMPVAKPAIVVGLAALVIVPSAVLTYTVYTYRPDLFFRSSADPVWLTLLDGLLVVVLVPMAEELFFRGWLWTGLKRPWGSLAAASVTAVMWLIPHAMQSGGIVLVLLLVIPAVILSVARQVGGSVRATIPIHMIYNLTAYIPLIALLVKSLQ